MWLLHLRQHLIDCEGLICYGTNINLVLLNNWNFVVIKRWYEISIVLFSWFEVGNLQWDNLFFVSDRWSTSQFKIEYAFVSSFCWNWVALLLLKFFCLCGFSLLNSWFNAVLLYTYIIFNLLYWILSHLEYQQFLLFFLILCSYILWVCLVLHFLNYGCVIFEAIRTKFFLLFPKLQSLFLRNYVSCLSLFVLLAHN